MYKLMIVDDEPIERKALRILLDRDFFNLNIVKDAPNGIKAVDYAKIYRPDIILMDIQMPGTTGIEAHKRIMRFLPNVQTIILSAYSEFRFAQSALKYGVVDYLLKPVKPNDLKNSISKAIESIKSLDASENNQSNNINPDITSDSIINIAMKYIEENFNKNITLDTVSEIVHLNPQYFSKYFKEKSGINFTQYLAKLRIKNAKNLIRKTDKTMAQIAFLVGYNDPAYFSRVFLKYENQSPSDYKKSIM